MTNNQTPIVHRRILVTPAVAEKMLAAKPDRQRMISEHTVQLYVAEMLADRWRENGETLKQDADGLLLDGQHRLTAIVRSGVSVWMTVAKGIDPEAFSTIDVGRKRTAGDIMSIAGLPNGKHQASLARLLMSIEHSHEVGTLGVRHYTPEELLVFARAHADEMELALALLTRIRNMKPNAAIAAALAYLHRFNEAGAAAFTVNIIEGAGLAANTAVLTLRNRLLEPEKASNEMYCRRIAEVISMYSAHIRGIATARMVPLLMTETGTLIMPVVQSDAKTAVDHRGRAMGRDLAYDTRRAALAKRGKSARKTGGE